MLTPLFRYCAGYAVFEITGDDKEDFINRCRREEIPIFYVAHKNRHLTAAIQRKRYKELRGLCRSCGVRTRVKRRVGVPFIWKRLCCRPGLLVGFVLAVSMMVLLSMFVWDVRVEGAPEMEAELSAQLQGLGVHAGTLKSALESRKFKQIIMRDNDRLSWVGITTTGSRLILRVALRTIPPGSVDRQTPVNIVAQRDGVIASISATDGQSAVTVGTAVCKGELLISAAVEDTKKTSSFLRHAAGSVQAYTEHTVSVTLPLERTVSLPGETRTYRYLHLLGVVLPTSISSPGEHMRVDSDVLRPLYVLGHETGIRVQTVEATEITEVSVTKTEEETLGDLRLAAFEKLNEELTNGTVLSREETVETKENQVTMTVRYACLEEIGVESPIETEF